MLHGAIREVSLVLAGANPGARIDNISFSHDDDDDYDDGEALIFNNDKIELRHSAEEAEKEDVKMANNEEKTVADVIDEMTDEQKNEISEHLGGKDLKSYIKKLKELEEKRQKMTIINTQK